MFAIVSGQVNSSWKTIFAKKREDARLEVISAVIEGEGDALRR